MITQFTILNQISLLPAAPQPPKEITLQIRTNNFCFVTACTANETVRKNAAPLASPIDFIMASRTGTLKSSEIKINKKLETC